MTITVIVDDNDTAIEYSGTWTASQPLSSNFSGISQSIGNTLHSFSTDFLLGSIFTYNFSGSSVSVFALMDPDAVNGASLPYPWSCSIDETQIQPAALQPLQAPTTVKLCEANLLQNEPHKLDFQYFPRISFSNNSIGYLDYIEYTPSPSTIPQTYDYVGISFDDPMILYSSTFGSDTHTPDNTYGQGIVVPNATAELDFTGSSLTWIGFFGTGTNATATYSIDEQPPVQFEIPAGSQTLEPGQIYFETSTLDPEAQHHLTVKYNGGPTVDPAQLYIQCIVVGNGTVPASGTNGTMSTTVSTPSPSTTPSTPQLTRANPHRVHIGLVIAGVLAGVVFIVVTIFIYQRKKWLRHRLQHTVPPASQPFNSDPNTLLERLIISPEVSAQGIKWRRRLIPQVRAAERLPPSKLTVIRESTQAPVPLRPETESQTALGTATAEAHENTPPVGPAEIIGIQEEDSGLRMLNNHVGEDNGQFMHALPPVYSAV